MDFLVLYCRRCGATILVADYRVREIFPTRTTRSACDLDEMKICCSKSDTMWALGDGRDIVDLEDDEVLEEKRADRFDMVIGGV